MKRVIKQKMEDGSLQIIHQNIGASSDSEDAIPAPYNTEEIITESGTWTAPVDGDYEVTVIGGGDGGYGFIANGVASANGGYSGEWIKCIKHYNAGQVITVTIGAGGSGVFNTEPYNSALLASTFGGATSFGDIITGGRGNRTNEFPFYYIGERAVLNSTAFDLRASNPVPEFYGAGGECRLDSQGVTNYAHDGKSGAVIIDYYDPRKDTSLSIGDQLVTDLYARLAALEAKVADGMLYNDEILITESGDFTVPYTGDFEVTLIGGGNGSYIMADRTAAGGGAGGEVIKKIMRLQEGQVIPVTIGAGGVSASNITTDYSSIHGGQTIFNGVTARSAFQKSKSVSPYKLNNGAGGIITIIGAGYGGGNPAWKTITSGQTDFHIVNCDAFYYGAGAGVGVFIDGSGNLNSAGVGNGYQGCVKLRGHNPNKS